MPVRATDHRFMMEEPMKFGDCLNDVLRTTFDQCLEADELITTNFETPHNDRITLRTKVVDAIEN